MTELRGRGKRVLVVEDDPQIQEVLCEVLVDEGYEVVTAGDGQAALSLLSGMVPDAAVMDVMMPFVDGPEVLRWMRASGTHATVPVLLMSASPMRIAADSEHSAFLRKPFDLQTLLDEVARLVRAGTHIATPVAITSP